jgi:hypothetical protein
MTSRVRCAEAALQMVSAGPGPPETITRGEARGDGRHDPQRAQPEREAVPASPHQPGRGKGQPAPDGEGDRHRGRQIAGPVLLVRWPGHILNPLEGPGGTWVAPAGPARPARERPEQQQRPVARASGPYPNE